MDVNAIQAELRRKRLEFNRLQEQVLRAKREVRRSQRKKGVHSSAHQISGKAQAGPPRTHSEAGINPGMTCGRVSPSPCSDAQRCIKESGNTWSPSGLRLPNKQSLSLEGREIRGLGFEQVMGSLGEEVCEEMKGEGKWDVEEQKVGERAGEGRVEDREGGTEAADKGKSHEKDVISPSKSELYTSSGVQSKPLMTPPCLLAASSHSTAPSKLSTSNKDAGRSTGDVAIGNEGNPVGGDNISPPMSPLVSSQSCESPLTPSPPKREGRERGTIPCSESEECDSSATVASSPSSQSFLSHSSLHCLGVKRGTSTWTFGQFSHPPPSLANHSQLYELDFFLPDKSFGQLKLQKLQSQHPWGNLSYGRRKPWITSTPVAMGKSRPGSSQCEVEMAACSLSRFPLSQSSSAPLSPLSGDVGSASPTAGLGQKGESLPAPLHPPSAGAISLGTRQECGLTCSLTKMDRGRVVEASADLWSACHFNQTNVSSPPLKEGSLLTAMDSSKRVHLLLSYTTGFCLLSFLLVDHPDHLQSHRRMCEENEILTATSLATGDTSGDDPPIILVATAGRLCTCLVRLYMFTTEESTCVELVSQSGTGTKEHRNAFQDFREHAALSICTRFSRSHSESLGVAVSMETGNPSETITLPHLWMVTKKGKWEVAGYTPLPLPEYLSHSTGISSLEWVQGEDEILLGIGQGTAIVWSTATGEMVNTVNLSCGASSIIPGLRLKTLQAVQEKGVLFLLLACERKSGTLEEREAVHSSCWMLALGSSTAGNHGNHFQLVQSYSHSALLSGSVHYCPGCHGDGAYTISAVSSNTVLVWQLNSPKPILKFTFGDGTSLHCVTWLGSREDLFALDSAGTLHHFAFAH